MLNLHTELIVGLLCVAFVFACMSYAASKFYMKKHHHDLENNSFGDTHEVSSFSEYYTEAWSVMTELHRLYGESDVPERNNLVHSAAVYLHDSLFGLGLHTRLKGDQLAAMFSFYLDIQNGFEREILEVFEEPYDDILRHPVSYVGIDLSSYPAMTTSTKRLAVAAMLAVGWNYEIEEPNLDDVSFWWSPNQLCL